MKAYFELQTYTSCTSIILTYFYFNFEKKIKIIFINSNCDLIFFYFASYINRNTIKKIKYIAGYSAITFSVSFPLFFLQ